MAIGRPEFVTADMVQPGAVVIDVGINRVDDSASPKGYRLAGDVKYAEVAEVESASRRCRAGLRPMTIAMLSMNSRRRSRDGWVMGNGIVLDF